MIVLDDKFKYGLMLWLLWCWPLSLQLRLFVYMCVHMLYTLVCSGRTGAEVPEKSTNCLQEVEWYRRVSSLALLFFWSLMGHGLSYQWTASELPCPHQDQDYSDKKDIRWNWELPTKIAIVHHDFGLQDLQAPIQRGTQLLQISRS